MAVALLQRLMAAIRLVGFIYICFNSLYSGCSILFYFFKAHNAVTRSLLWKVVIPGFITLYVANYIVVNYIV